MTEDQQKQTSGLQRRWLALMVWQRVLVVVLGVTLVFGVIAGLSHLSSEREREARERDVDELVQALTPVTVFYEVEGDPAYAEVTMQTPTGTSQQSPDLPMKLESGELLKFEFPRGEFVYLSAQNPDESGSVTCRITVNGTVVSENTSSGSYAIATCKGST